MFIDFSEIKSRVSLLDGMRIFDLNMRQLDSQFRGSCPACEGSDERSLVITPGRGWYCQVAKKGGDVISLGAHVKQIGLKESARILAEGINVKEQMPEETQTAFDPEKYAESLDSSIEALRPYGINPELCNTVGLMGVSTKGINRGKLVFPLRGEFGEFIDFIGVDSVSLPKKWRL